jgi:hypothetical protein
VLADHVEPQRLLAFEVEPQRLVGRRGVDAVRPVTLVERAKLEHELPVEQRAHDPADHRLAQ